jgi:hypothetical protein
MRGIRKVIGVLMILFIGIPTLLAMIWAVGVTRAAVSPEVLSELPQEIIAKVPDLLDEVLKSSTEDSYFGDDETRTWVRAMAKVDTTPKQLLEKIGIMNWLETELSQRLGDIGKMLRGEIRTRRIVINLRPLKSALLHQDIDDYLLKVMENLPKCSQEQEAEWMEATLRRGRVDLPPCLPVEPVKAVEILRMELEKDIQQIPNEWDIFKVDDFDSPFFLRERGIDILKIVASFSFLLFLVPAFFIGLASLIGASSGSGILKWMGVSTLIGGGIAFLLSRFTGEIARWGINWGYYDANIDFPIGEVLYDKTGDLATLVIDTFFSKINAVAGTVCIVGIVLIALSYLVGSGDKPVKKQSANRTPPPNSSGPDRNRQTPPPTPGNTPSETDESVIIATLEPDEPEPKSPPVSPPSQPGIDSGDEQHSLPKGSEDSDKR